MKKRAATRTRPRAGGMKARRIRSMLPSASRKRTARVSARRAGTRTGRRRRTVAAAGKLRATRRGRTSRSAKSTTDHDEIRKWVESRGGHPATVKSTARGRRAAGVLRIDFPGFSGQESLKAISWDKWFDVFEKQNLVFHYQKKQNSRLSNLARRKR